MDHDWKLMVTTENFERGGCDFYYWCQNCGAFWKKPGLDTEDSEVHIPTNKECSL